MPESVRSKEIFMKKMNIWKTVLLVIFLLLAAGVISILAVKMNIKKERKTFY